MKFYKVKLFFDVPESERPVGIPLEWIAEMNPYLGEEVVAPYVVMTEAETLLHKADFQDEFDAWMLGVNTPTQTEYLSKKIDEAGTEGARIVRQARNILGAKNLLMGKTEAQIIAAIEQLAPIKSALEGGALKSARTQIQALKATHPEYETELDWVIAEITKFTGA